MNIGINIASIAPSAVAQIEAQLPTRAVLATNELRNAAIEVLSGQGGGRRYGRHQASAPGQPPAVRTGALRGSWRPISDGGFNPGIETSIFYAGYLEGGTSKMAARPFVDKIVETAEPMVAEVYNMPFDLHF